MTANPTTAQGAPDMARHTGTGKPSVLVVTPVYNEEGGLADYERRVRQTLLDRQDCDFRVLFVDDGSMDRSWEIIEDICARDGRFRGLRLSRNFGPHAAINAGFDQGDADALVILACDLQDPPEVVLEMVEKWRAGAQIVWGRRRSRAEGPVRKFLSNAFQALLRRHAMPRNSKFTTGSFLLCSRKVAECYRQFQEHSRITFALVAWTGFPQDVVDYDRDVRRHGCSGWNFGRMLKAMFDALVGFSGLPARVMTWTGLAISLLSMAFSAYLLLSWLLHGTQMPGWPSIMLGICFFFGVQFLFMGIMGEYLSRIYLESMRRPNYFVSQRAGGEPEQDGAGHGAG